ncbi:ABC transporter permease [Aestuariirhabdus litorea]|uniref:ABC transporter permease n=1 Tax=Aestuariirhabdus litorea TaxID=2528527 RepID=A0A3P3VK44_9GAMM|nr:ABC transporter permease [Aestuariirhabdus litorea]RRJ83095.1 ABC transporter permease [Aestuariirhabdus litorea]RWW93252.1 ABC transporter permease [Endozoicomonadaceae bacterium GTF-13]
MSLSLQRRAQESRLMAYCSPLLALLLTLVTGALLFWVQGREPLQGLYTFFVLPVSDLYGLSELGVKAAPILLCATGLALCYRANVWNIGAEGQLLMGALIGSALALQWLGSESGWALPLVLVTGSLAGMAWAAIPAVLKNHFNTNEILTTIMLNYIALNLLLFAVHGPLKDPGGFNFPESALFSDSTLLPVLMEGYRLHLGALLALLAVVVAWVILSRTFVGFQIRVLGLDSSAAHYAGFREKKLVMMVLLFSGAMAGLAGVSEVTGPIGQLVPTVSPGYGYSAIIVAFLGRLHPVGIFLASLLMALVYMGSEMGQIEMGLPLALGGLFQGVLLFFLLACDFLILYRVRWVRAGRDAAASEA